MAGISLSKAETALWRIIEAILSLAAGASNVVGEVTLTPGATTTVVDVSVSRAATNVSMGMQIFLTPRTANAAAVLLGTYVSSVGQGTFTRLLCG